VGRGTTLMRAAAEQLDHECWRAPPPGSTWPLTSPATGARRRLV